VLLNKNFKNMTNVKNLIYGLVLLAMVSCGEKESIADVAPEKEKDIETGGSVIFDISTVAGIGSAGSADGDLTTGSFNTPIGIAEGLDGNLFIADQTNHKIRKITIGQGVSTYAGTGILGYSNGMNGQFNRPYGIVVDSKGNIFVADYANHSIRKVSIDGEVSTFAGINSGGWVDGVGGAARFNLPFALAIDHADNLFVSDHRNNRIRKINPDGLVSTLAGSGEAGFLDGAAMEAKFDGPTGITVDQEGNVYVSEYYNNVIRKIGVDGIVSTIAGDGSRGYSDGDAFSAKFNQPYDVAVDHEGKVYVADYSNHMIRMVDLSTMKVSTIAGDGVAGFLNGRGNESRFRFPAGITVGKDGEVYVVDRSNHAIRKLTKIDQ